MLFPAQKFLCKFNFERIAQIAGRGVSAKLSYCTLMVKGNTRQPV